MSAAHEVAGVLLAQLAAFLAVLLVVSAAHKALSWRRTGTVVQNFAGVPRAAASAAAVAVCSIEVGSAPAMPGRTKRIATNTAMAPAALRMMVPKARPIIPSSAP